MSYEPPGLSRKFGNKYENSSNRLASSFSSGEKPAVNGVSGSFSRPDDSNERRNYKLLIDPVIKKGHQKIYRFDGVFPGQLPVVPKDPRSRRTRIWKQVKADLPVPNFKVDKNYVGIPPQREVLFTGLNDNVDKKFLQEMCERYGKIENIKVYYDAVTKKHSGKGRVIFSTTTAAKLVISKLDSTSVMGNIIRATLEPNLKALKHMTKQHRGDHAPHRRGSNEDDSIAPRHRMPAVPPKFLTHLPTPPSSMTSHSPLSEASFSTPTMPMDPRLESPLSLKPPPPPPPPLASDASPDCASSWSKISFPKQGPLMSPQSLGSSSASFEPISPPPAPRRLNEPPPPPPPDRPPSPPDEEPATSQHADDENHSAYLNFEDISPDPVFSPEENNSSSTKQEESSYPAKPETEALTKDQSNDVKINRLIESCRRNASRSSHGVDSKGHSPRAGSWSRERKHYGDRDDRRDRYRDKDRSSDGWDRDRGDRDHYSPRERRFEKRTDFKAGYRHRKSRWNDRREELKDDYKKYDKRDNHDRSWSHRRDRYSTSPRQTEDRRRPESSDITHKVHDSRRRDREADSRTTHHTYQETGRHVVDAKEGEITDKESDLHRVSKNEAFAKSEESTSFDSGSVASTEVMQNHSEDNASTGEPVKVPDAAEIISQVVSGDAQSKTKETVLYDEDAYTVGIEACSDEEPLPPGDEGDVADKVNKERSRNKLKAAQDNIRKRKYSCETADDKQGSSVKLKKQIQIVVRSRQLSETTESGLSSCMSMETPCKAEDNDDLSDNFRGGWTTVSHESESNTLPDDSSVQKELGLPGNFPVVEDISPCPSPTSVQVTECTITTTEAIVKTSEEELPSAQLYSDMDVNDGSGGVDNDNDAPDDDDNMSLSSISSNEETFQVNEPVKKASPRQKPVPVGVPPPRLQFPPFPPPPSFNPSVPPPVPFNPMVPPPPFGHVTVPPPAICPPSSIPLVPPPSIPPPTVPPITVPPPPINPAVPPPPILPSAVPHMAIPPPGIPPPMSAVPPPSVPPHIPPPPLRNPGFYDGVGMPPYPNRGSKFQETPPPAPQKTWKGIVTDEVYSAISSELEKMVNRDVFRKLIETSAFKALEAWWDNQTKPKQSASQLAKRAPGIRPPHDHAPSTVGQVSSMSSTSSMLGPSPFERQHSMVVGIKASLPKLPSFKVKRTVPPAKHEEDPAPSHKRTGTDSPVPDERANKRHCPEDSEVDAELDSSRGADRRPRTTSRMDEEERSESPWQHLDDSMDAAPPATRVRSTRDFVEAGRRTSTGSSLYHTVYSSSEGSGAEDESESGESEAEESAAESGDDEEETEADSEEETDEESEDEQKEHDANEAPEDELESSTRNSTSSPGSPRPETTELAVRRTVETVTLSETTNYQVQRAAAMDELAEVAARFKRPAPAAAEGKEKEEEEEGGSGVEERTSDSRSETDAESTLTERQTAQSSSELDEAPRSSEGLVYSPACLSLPSEAGRLDRESATEETETASDNDEVFGELAPTPEVSVKSRAVSLVELDHSYGLSASEEEPVLPPPREPDAAGLESWPEDQRTPSPIIDVENGTADALFLLPEEPLPAEPVLVKPSFPARSFEQDDQLVYEMLRCGMDAEDARYLKVGFQRLLQVGSESVQHAHWGYHPVCPQSNTISSKRRKQRLECGVRVHASGCARSEGFYKLSMSEKARYLETARRQLQVQEQQQPDEQQKFDSSKAKQQSREHRLVQRRLQSAVIKEDYGDLLKFNQLRVRKKQLKFAKSAIHDWGLFAQEPIAADEMVIEYVGEMIRQPVADLRERRYEEMGIGSSYMFRVDQETIIDATTLGNLARFINHCCDPNCYARIISVENNKKIVIYSKRDIKINEEITYDYKFPIEEEKIPCLCGVPQCRGTLN